jgi:hypothetical protein
MYDNTIESSGGEILGGAVFLNQGSRFIIGGTARIHASDSGTMGLGQNDICLHDSSTLEISGPLAADMVAIITPQSYDRIKPLLQLTDSLTATTLAAECGKFAVTPNSGTLWAIDDHGLLTQTINDESSLQSAVNSVNVSGISATITLTSDINLTRGFSGKDADHKVTIDGDNDYHIVISNDSTDIVFKNANFQNGYTSGCGGMLKLVGKDLSDDDEMESAENLPSLTIENCSFTNCETSGNWGADGGSIYVKGYGEMALKNTTFQGSGNYQIAMSGGFIAAFLHKTQGLEMTIEGCSFTGGTAGYGGAINIHAPNDASITIDSCIFTNNIANPDGTAGAIDNFSSATLNISNTTFTNNEGDHVENGTKTDNVFLREGSQAILTDCTINGEVVNGTKIGAF